MAGEPGNVNGWIWDETSQRWRVRRGTAYVTAAYPADLSPEIAAHVFAVELAEVRRIDDVLKELAARDGLNSFELAAIRRVRHLLYGGDPDASGPDEGTYPVSYNGAI